MAEHVGISRMSVNRIWKEHKLKPHQVKVSNAGSLKSSTMSMASIWSPLKEMDP